MSYLRYICLLLFDIDIQSPDNTRDSYGRETVKSRHEQPLPPQSVNRRPQVDVHKILSQSNTVRIRNCVSTLSQNIERQGPTKGELIIRSVRTRF